jgi:DHA1 family tetracycline resistance protein-like MFS transporter
MVEQKADGELNQQAASRALTSLIAVNFAGSLGYTVVMPFLVFLVLQWGGDEIVYSVVLASYPIFQLFGSPLLGRWSDVYGRRRVLMISQLGSFLAWVLVLIAFTVPMHTLATFNTGVLGSFTLTVPLLLLLLSRSLDGLTGGNVSIANAYVADISTPDNSNENFGKLGAAANLGEVVGPAAAGVLAGTALGYGLPVMVAAAISLFAVIMVVTRLPDLKMKPAAPSGALPSAIDATTGRACHYEADASEKPLHQLLALPGIAALLFVAFLINLAFSFFYVAMPLNAAQNLHWTPRGIGVFFAIMSFFMVIVQSQVLPRASKHCSNKVLIVAGSIILGAGFAALYFSRPMVIYTGAFLIAVGNGLSWPTLIASLSGYAGEHQGAVQGLAGSIGAIASILGLLSAGLLFGQLGSDLFVLAAGLMLLVLVVHVCRK